MPSDESKPSWWERHGPAVLAALAVAGLAVYAYVVRIRFLTSSPYPIGIDGYYYPIQIRALLETGELFYPSAPLVLWLMAPAGWATDPILGAKIVAAAGTALATVPAYLVGRRISGARSGGVLASALAATSAQGFYLSTEFVKQGVGLTVALSFLAALGAALDRSSRRRWALAALLLVACGLTHKIALGVAIVAGLPAAAWFAWRRGNKRLLVGLGAFVVLFVAAVFVVGAIAPKSFVTRRDLGLLGGMLTLEADWSFAALIPPRGSPLTFRYEIAQAAAIAIAGIGLSLAARRLARVPSNPPLGWGLAALALFLAIPWIDVRDEQAMGMRLRLSVWIALAALAPLVAIQIQRCIEAIAKTRIPDVARDAALIAFALALPLLLPSRSREGVIMTHPALATAVRALDGVVPPGGRVVTPERHVLYMATWYARVPAFLTIKTDADPSTRYRLLPGALINKDLRAALDHLRAHPSPDIPPPHDLHPFDENGLVLLTEATWVKLLQSLPPDSRARYVDPWRIQ